jgi:hypothetical protein
VNEEALAHWRAVAPKTNKQTNKRKVNSSEESLLHTAVPNATGTLISNYGKKIPTGY